ncbi:MAG: MinD/ParA family protein [Thermodesulfobacteriota bacterium]
MSRVLAVASGKGGTGKTSVSVNLSLALGRAGRRVCLLDADLGLSNVDVLLGLSPEVTLEQVLFDGVPMERAVIPAGTNLDVVPGGSGVARLADLSHQGRVTLAGEFAKLSGYDYLVVDGSPGISSPVIAMCMACPELLVVVNPDPSSITDAYALVKVLAGNGLRRSPHVLLNRVKSASEAQGIFSRLRAAMLKHLGLDARFLGHIPQDPHMASAAARQRPLVELYPASASGRAIMTVARALDEARLPAGTRSAGPAEVMRSAVVRMKESAPVRTAAFAPAEARQALDAAMRLAGTLGAGEAGQGRVIDRLRSLLAKARDCLGEAPPPAASSQPGGGRPAAAVISSDEAVGAIIRESLESAGIRVASNGTPPGAAVVYWRAAPEALSRRLDELGPVPFVLVRPISARETPRLGRAPSEVMDMPFRLSELAGAVKRLAMGKKAV